MKNLSRRKKIIGLVIIVLLIAVALTLYLLFISPDKKQELEKSEDPVRQLTDNYYQSLVNKADTPSDKIDALLMQANSYKLSNPGNAKIVLDKINKKVLSETQYMQYGRIVLEISVKEEDYSKAESIINEVLTLNYMKENENESNVWQGFLDKVKAKQDPFNYPDEEEN